MFSIAVIQNLTVQMLVFKESSSRGKNLRKFSTGFMRPEKVDKFIYIYNRAFNGGGDNSRAQAHAGTHRHAPKSLFDSDQSRTQRYIFSLLRVKTSMRQMFPFNV